MRQSVIPARRAAASRIYDTEAAEPVILSDSEESQEPANPSVGEADSSPCTGEPDEGVGALDDPAAHAFIKLKGRANTQNMCVFARPLCFFGHRAGRWKRGPLARRKRGPLARRKRGPLARRKRGPLA